MPRRAGLHPILQKYEQVKWRFKQNAISGDVTNILQELYSETNAYLSRFDTETLTSDRPAKEYFAFKIRDGGKLSSSKQKLVFD